MKVLSFVKSLDFLGPEVKFRINKQDNFKTIFGGIFSILYYLAFISFFILFGGDFFLKKNPKIVSQTLTDSTFNKTIELSNDNFFFAFKVNLIDSRSLQLNFDPDFINFSQEFISINYKDSIKLNK